MPQSPFLSSSTFRHGPFAPKSGIVWQVAARMGIQRLAWGIYGFCLLVIWTTFASTMAASSRSDQDLRVSRAHLNAKGFAEYVGLNMFAVDGMLAGLGQEFLSGKGLPAQTEIDRRTAGLGLTLLQVAVADATGRIVGSTLPLTGPVSIADRKHFLDVKADPRDRLYIGQPVIGRVSKRMSLQLVRPLHDAAGRFQGVIVGSIDPTALQTYFRNYDGLANGGAVSLVGTDGIVRLRMQGDAITWGQDIQGTAHWSAVRDTARGGFTGKSPVDGQIRDYAFTRVGDYPLSVIAGYGKPGFIDLGDPVTSLSLGLATAFSLVLGALAYLISQLASAQSVLIRRLRESREKALEANRMKSNFLAAVSHELRTPLNSILGFSELIRDLAPDTTLRKYGDLVHRSGKHLLALVGTVLDLAKIEAGRMELTPERIDMRELLEAIVEVHKVSADKKQLTLSLSLPADEELVFMLDRTKYVQVLNNVLHNAIKFTQQGAIFVAGELTDDRFVVSVIDTGCGIAAEMQAKVFERFNTIGSRHEQQLDHGTGLGLALSRELMELMGGQIDLHSDVGVGTHVRISLPIPRKEPSNEI
ncbi:ATP-binding protein [Variovorax sp. VNK109]|uniref:sensor histidine kinase n=1 Tax=Variovorax sp. VNK109 TaxID=3400919 RepID=UPI003C124FE5